MNKIQLLADTSCDLPKNRLDEYAIELIPFNVTFDNKNYLRENVDITIDEYYKKLCSGNIFPKTSLPSVQQYMDMFTKYLTNGCDILCICLSSKFSGSYQSAINAKNILNEDFPNNKIIVIDSMLATIGQGNLVMFAGDLIKECRPIEEIETIVKQNRNNCVIYFTVSSLEYLQKGGRVGKCSSLAGNLLNINPILKLGEGELLPICKVRGRKKAIAKLLELTLEKVETYNAHYKFDFLAVNDMETINELMNKLNENLGITKKYDPVKIGVTISTYTGCSVVGIAVTNFSVTV